MLTHLTTFQLGAIFVTPANTNTDTVTLTTFTSCHVTCLLKTAVDTVVDPYHLHALGFHNFERLQIS